MTFQLGPNPNNQPHQIPTLGPTPPTNPNTPPGKQPDNKKPDEYYTQRKSAAAGTSLTLALLGLFCIGPILAPLSLLLGIIGLRKPWANRSSALTGTVLSALNLIIWAALLIWAWPTISTTYTMYTQSNEIQTTTTNITEQIQTAVTDKKPANETATKIIQQTFNITPTKEITTIPKTQGITAISINTNETVAIANTKFCSEINIGQTPGEALIYYGTILPDGKCEGTPTDLQTGITALLNQQLNAQLDQQINPQLEQQLDSELQQQLDGLNEQP